MNALPSVRAIGPGVGFHFTLCHPPQRVSIVDRTSRVAIAQLLPGRDPGDGPHVARRNGEVYPSSVGSSGTLDTSMPS